MKLLLLSYLTSCSTYQIGKNCNYAYQDINGELLKTELSVCEKPQGDKMNDQVFKLLVDKIDKVDRDIENLKTIELLDLKNDVKEVKQFKWQIMGGTAVVSTIVGIVIQILLVIYGKK